MRKLIYIIAIVWVAAFIWQTIAHAKILFPPLPFDHNGGLNLRTADNSARHRTAFSKSFVTASRTARPSTHYAQIAAQKNTDLCQDTDCIRWC